MRCSLEAKNSRACRRFAYVPQANLADRKFFAVSASFYPPTPCWRRWKPIREKPTNRSNQHGRNTAIHFPFAHSVWNHRDPQGLSEMTRDHWVENLRCPWCLQTGRAEVSAADKLSWDVEVDRTPEGFKVIHSADNYCNFYCASCDVPAEP
jgi:hypothetical protein